MAIAAAAFHTSIKDRIFNLFVDLEQEVVREVHSPHDFSQSDNIVRNHIDGLAISFFVLISLFLGGTITIISLH